VEPEAAAVGRSLAEALEPAAARALLARRRPRDAARAWALLARRGFAAEVVEDAVASCGAPALDDDASG
jgi:hypothetical protein